eukprot:CAMPEP_0117052572 /NCGR_PEP_ID=MMETSP0472-20121206/36341_1 /TAXON_ID=693140 ORGANISM="Tiarina fusus, Strain LIS" /NCGR_SAMPLE_ID=MMETSP0472 /ASSEMBLY_ACC=CAM_ASM_000603 /LENGTH=172 /DNA_ID=CAMNT_0004767253 /DNA_START=85 /DNA_END=603 /DNA_ORIENTATION=-
MAISKVILIIATLLGSSAVGSAFSTNEAPKRNIVTGYSSDENVNVPAPYPQDVGKFCDEILCSFDDYEEIIYKLQHQRQALVRRTEVIDNFLDTLNGTLEENRLGSDPNEIPQLAAKARTIFKVEQLRLELRKERPRVTPCGRFIPRPPECSPSLANFLAQDYEARLHDMDP